MRPELAPLPARMQSLPLDGRGYPVPWFVEWIDGAPEFRLMDATKYRRALRERRCWCCGQALGRYVSFVIGPMCAVNRVSSEPPSHLECAEWSARNCPFLSRPHMVRREDEVTAACTSIGGHSIRRNPGVALVWTTRHYRVFRDPKGGPLLQLGDPTSTSWWREGRAATRAEVVASIESGLPALLELAVDQGADAVEALYAMLVDAYQYLPVDDPPEAVAADVTLEDTTRHLASAQARPSPDSSPMACRVCGCTDDQACPGGCAWAAPSLCSRCAG